MVDDSLVYCARSQVINIASDDEAVMSSPDLALPDCYHLFCSVVNVFVWSAIPTGSGKGGDSSSNSWNPNQKHSFMMKYKTNAEIWQKK